MHSEVRADPTDTRTRRRNRPYAVDLRYAYRIDGLEYVSDRLSLRDTAVWNKPAAERVVASYPIGAAVMARVSPDDPEYAVLEVGVSQISFFLFLGSVFATIGGVWMVRGLQDWPR